MDKKSSFSWRSFFTYSVVVTFSLLLFLYAGPSQNPGPNPQVIAARTVDRDPVVRNLTKRALSYEDAIPKGNRLHCLMAKKQSDPPPIEAASYLQTHGIETAEGWVDATDAGTPFFGTKLTAALRGLGVSGSLQDISWDHEKSTKILSDPDDENSERVTSAVGAPSGAFFYSSFFPRRGVIIADNNFSVDAAIKEDKNLVAAEITTHVRRWSDAAWMQWTKACDEEGIDDVSNVQYIFRATVINENSLSIILQALRQKYKDSPSVPPIGPWNSRLTLDVTQNPDEFYAVLGSPNGSGVAFLLMTHKAALGIKTINKVDIFVGDTNPYTIPSDGIDGADAASIVVLFYVTAP
ncbi:hypothetical protein N5P37_009961 [Trichoderma harzianum]|nr:hypothetical protein N5P37_009961 [Trichoderma harzianum]